MDVDIRGVREDEVTAFLVTIEHAFGHHPDEQELARERSVLDPERCLAAVDEGEIVGTAVALDLELTVPGAAVAAAGVSGVGVLPTHRRRGILTALMRRQLDELRDRDVPMAALHASEGAIYGRFGYGLATLAAHLEIETARSGFLRPDPPSGRIALVDRDGALAAMPSVFESVRAGRAGFVSRPTEATWRATFADLEAHRAGGGPLFFALHRRAGTVEGYAAYRVRERWGPAGPDNTLHVVELIAATPESCRALWRYCLDVDLVTRVEAGRRPADEPLLHMVLEPRRLRMSLDDGLWVRLIDVPAALAARRYSREGRLVLDLRDPFCPWNEARFELDGGPDGATCVRTNRPPDLSLDAAGLAAAYLGGVGIRTLERAGRIGEETAGALARADGMFAADQAPWCPVMF